MHVGESEPPGNRAYPTFPVVARDTCGQPLERISFERSVTDREGRVVLRGDEAPRPDAFRTLTPASAEHEALPGITRWADGSLEVRVTVGRVRVTGPRGMTWGHPVTRPSAVTLPSRSRLPVAEWWPGR